MSSEIATLNSFVALVISLLALVYTAKTYLLKSGMEIRGTYTITSDMACQDKYVRSITIENLKDRSIVIFKIYLQIGHNYFVEIEDFTEQPLTLKPFEAFKRAYDPIDLYTVNCKRIFMNDLLDRKVKKKKLVLSTSEGKYVIKENIKSWNPISNFFKNHMTAVIRPLRSTYQGKAFGGNVKYLIEFIHKEHENEVVAIYPKDYEIKRFARFRLTKEALESVDSLKLFLEEKRKDGLIKSDNFKVIEVESWRKENYSTENKKIINAKYCNWFTYYVVGRLLTKVDTYRLKKRNKANRRKAKDRR